MKTSKRFPPLLVAAIPLAAFVLAGPGCGKPPESSPPAKVPSKACNRPGIPVTVFVSYDTSTNPPPAKATTANKTVYLCEERDWVEWVSCDGIVSENMTWTNGSPFLEQPKHEKQVLKSKPPKKGTAGQRFTYEAELVLKDGTKKPIEPIIEVME